LKKEKHIHECLILKRLCNVSVCLVILFLFSSSTGGGDFFNDINQSDFFTDTDAGGGSPEKDVQSVEPSRSRPSDFDPFARQASTDTLFDETKPFTALDIDKRWEIIKEAVFNLMDHHIPNLVEKKLVLLGDKATFAEYITKINTTEELDIKVQAPAQIKKDFWGPGYIFRGLFLKVNLGLPLKERNLTQLA
jgi:hypothetical protein